MRAAPRCAAGALLAGRLRWRRALRCTLPAAVRARPCPPAGGQRGHALTHSVTCVLRAGGCVRRAGMASSSGMAGGSAAASRAAGTAPPSLRAARSLLRRSVRPLLAVRPGLACAPSVAGGVAPTVQQCPAAARRTTPLRGPAWAGWSAAAAECSPPLPFMLRGASCQPPRAVGSLQMGHVRVHARLPFLCSSALRLRLLHGKGGYRLG